MDWLLYLVALGFVKSLQSLPLRWVVHLGRAGGGLAYWLDARHRRVALENLTACFQNEKSPREIHGLARENFQRLGENYCAALKTASMSWEKLRPHLTVRGADRIRPQQGPSGAQNRVLAVGHFGNFELYARADQLAPGFRFATTYRGLRQPALNRLLQSLREQSGCLFFERRTEATALKKALGEGNLLVGFLADQHAGKGGLWLPFFGRECSTNVAPAVVALRYRCPLYTAICYRTGVAQWEIEVGKEIPTEAEGRPRPVADISIDINRALEAAVRRDPANWFWVHKRWKPRPPVTGTAQPKNTPLASPEPDRASRPA